MLRTATQRGRVVLVVGSVVAATAGAVALRADALVTYGFGKAFGAQKAAPPFELAAPGSRLQKGEVGDETYWRTRAEFDGPAPFDRRLAVGDRITIAGRDGRARNLEVVGLKAMSAPLLKIAVGAAPVPLLLVICRVIDATDPQKQELVRFMIEAEEEAKPATLPGPQEPLGRT